MERSERVTRLFHKPTNRKIFCGNASDTSRISSCPRLPSRCRTHTDRKPQSQQQEPLGGPSTHSRFENHIESKAIFELQEILVDRFLDSYDSPIEEIIFDYDATDENTHGQPGPAAFQ